MPTQRPLSCFMCPCILKAVLSPHFYLRFILTFPWLNRSFLTWVEHTLWFYWCQKVQGMKRGIKKVGDDWPPPATKTDPGCAHLSSVVLVLWESLNIVRLWLY